MGLQLAHFAAMVEVVVPRLRRLDKHHTHTHHMTGSQVGKMVVRMGDDSMVRVAAATGPR